jgi:squalene synthase HpnC
MEKNAKISLEKAYQVCEQLAKNHYENFPVASCFLPATLRKPITVFYAFARFADDIVDEGPLTPEERLEELDAYWQHLVETLKGNPPNLAIFIALQDTLLEYPEIPTELLFDLLRAFKQDITQKNYENFAEIESYCRWSANPIGRLLLHLTANANEQNCRDSDAICTALQLINFIQDIHPDLILRNRCYLPQDEIRQFSANIEDIRLKQETPNLQALIQQQITRATALLQSGRPLGKRLKNLFGLEIRLITEAGFSITQKLCNRNSIYQRPTLKKWQMPLLFLKALI